MLSFIPSLDPVVATENLTTVIRPGIRGESFSADMRRLRLMNDAFTRGCPPPWPAPGAAITPELSYQSELWLPLAQIAPAFIHLYRASLTMAPLLSSTPFSTSTSWAGIVSRFPQNAGWPANPALLLERLLSDGELRTSFLCWSFMPARFYGGGSDRYPGQSAFIRHWLGKRRERGGELSCLDAACGDGQASYALMRILVRQGWQPERLRVEGWTLDPLEVWAAAHLRFPHAPSHEAVARRELSPAFVRHCRKSMLFRLADLERLPDQGKRFDLIVCNGLLGGPIVNQQKRIEAILRALSSLLRPEGVLLAADHFHGGWKKRIPPEQLAELFRSCGLSLLEAGEGIGGIR